MSGRYPRPAVLDQIAPDRHAIIEASAGTGKTYTLEHLVLDRILGGVEVGQILVLTFTDKAATEMRERIRKLLRTLYELPEDAGREHAPDACWVIDPAARKRIRAALEGFDSATISTIHAFCNGILGEQAFANRRLFQENTVDLRSLFSAAFVETLREAVLDEEVGPLVEAWMASKSSADLEDFLYDCHRAPGRLEPKLDEERLRELFEAFPLGDADEAILAEAWEETKRRTKSRRYTKTLVGRYVEIRDILRDVEDDPWERLLAGWLVLGLARSRKSHLAEILSFLEEMVDPPPEVEALGRFCRELPRALPALSALIAERVLPAIEARLAERKRAEGLLDYDEMLRALRSTLEGPEGGALVEDLRQRYRYAILDEFQDTDEVQWAIFRKLFFEGSAGHVLYAIGDPKQAIYGFRGADVGTYLEAREEILSAGGAKVVLAHCYRATAALIEGYNRIFDQTAPAPYFSGAIRYDDPVACGRPELGLMGPGGDPAAPIHVFAVDAKTKAEERLHLFATRTAQEIRRLVRPEDPALLWDEGKGPRPLTHKDIYVLYRSGAEGRAIAEVLRGHGIPFAFYKEEGLFQRPEAWAWLDLLRALAAPEDPSLRLRAWMSPFFGISLSRLPLTRDLPNEHPLRRRLQDWAEDARARDYDRLIPRVLDESGILRRAIAAGDERGLTNFLHLAELILERAHHQAPGCEALADWLHALIEERARPERENGSQQRLETERDAVQLMTLHASKGLEAPVVFLVSKLTDATPPSDLTRYRDEAQARCFWVGRPPPEVKESAQREEKEEAERLLYVALTRAKGRLYLPLAAGQGDFVPLLERLRALREEAPAGFVWEAISESAAGPPDPARDGAIAWVDEEADETEAFAARRRRHLGFIITSYSRMRGFRGVEEEEERIEGERMVVEPGPDELPGGAASGIFLHDVLARIPPEAVPASLEAFREEPRIRRVFEAAVQAHGIAPVHRAHAWRLLWAALSTPVTRVGLEGGVVRAERWLAEMEFLYPLPPPADGFVKGFVDLIFEAGGRVHFADWKSDSLPSFDAAYLRRYVQGSYELQVRLYTIALRKLYGLESERAYEARFGGAFYFFLRGMEKEGEAGIYFERPSFQDVLRWERELEKA